jgi:hypothetical protein
VVPERIFSVGTFFATVISRGTILVENYLQEKNLPVHIRAIK